MICFGASISPEKCTDLVIPPIEFSVNINVTSGQAEAVLLPDHPQENRMPEIKLVFSDVDSTLIHPHSKNEYGEYLGSSGLLLVDRGSFLSPQVVDRIQRIKGYGIPFIFITSRRLATYNNLVAVVQPTIGILEDGGVIVDDRGNFDMDWLRLMENTIGPAHDVINGIKAGGDLWGFKRMLEARYKESSEMRFADEGFLASFKIEFPISDKPLLARDISAYLSDKGITFPDSLKYSYNSKYNSLVIIPRQAGKANAAKYIADRHHVAMENVAAMGDDYNDQDVLRLAGYAFTTSDAEEQIRELVAGKEKGWIISSGGHEGTIIMLDRLLSLLG